MTEQMIKNLGRHDSDPYFKYLCRLVKKGNPDGESYHFLMLQLYQVTFYSIRPNDDNRERDGEHLRDEFIEKYPDEEVDYVVACSMLEMLIGLAYRMEGIIVGEPFEKTMSECFWLFLNNLGLDLMDDHTYLHHNVDVEVDEKLRIFVNRGYERDGNGGLFPLNRPKRDQTKIEIWYQMSDYLLENYDF